MQKRDAILITVMNEIEQSGGVIEDIRQAKGSHRIVYWRRVDGSKAVSTVPCYSGNHRSLSHARSNIRRLIREAQTND